MLPVSFRLLEADPDPVIDHDHPDAADNRFGFEGGTVVKVEGVYHLFTAEMAGEPFWVRMRLAHWTSPDARVWQRRSTLRETDGRSRELTGLDHESVWAPMPVYDEIEGAWSLFYVTYDTGGATGGRIRRAVSAEPGMSGIGGPYRDTGIVLQPGAQSQPWEGFQGTDSFFPYRADDGWHAFYGSHEVDWPVGLATAPDLAGPWKRRERGNPLAIEPAFVENPVVTRVGELYVAVYDCTYVGAPTYAADAHDVGYTCSEDGLIWSPGGRITVQPAGPGNWSRDIRTPLCLIDEGGGVYTMLYTGEHRDRKYWPVGRARLELMHEKERRK